TSSAASSAVACAPSAVLAPAAGLCAPFCPGRCCDGSGTTVSTPLSKNFPELIMKVAPAPQPKIRPASSTNRGSIRITIRVSLSSLQGQVDLDDRADREQARRRPADTQRAAPGDRAAPRREVEREHERVGDELERRVRQQRVD